jgi:hypothetical protein
LQKSTSCSRSGKFSSANSQQAKALAIKTMERNSAFKVVFVVLLVVVV